MIKLFNENWDSFEDYIRMRNNVNSDSASAVRPKEKFNEKDFEIVGLPSGQIIYMTKSQLNYFKSREVVNFIKTWKKPIEIDGKKGHVPVKLNKYCFHDSDYNDIIELIEDIITWD